MDIEKELERVCRDLLEIERKVAKGEMDSPSIEPRLGLLQAEESVLKSILQIHQHASTLDEKTRKEFLAAIKKADLL